MLLPSTVATPMSAATAKCTCKTLKNRTLRVTLIKPGTAEISCPGLTGSAFRASLAGDHRRSQSLGR